MHALAGTGMAVASTDRDADFGAYMNARQASLLRTAYLLSGDRHTAEDLVQTSLAKLYLSWDRVRDQGSIDGYVRRILVNENNSLWRRAWKRRESPARRCRTATTTTSTTPVPVAKLWDLVQTLPRKARAVVVLRYYEELLRGRDRRGARHLRRHREVTGQPRAGLPARTSSQSLNPTDHPREEER